MTQLRSILIFEQAIKSDATKKAYKYQLNKFKKWAKIKSFDGLLQAPQKNIQILLEDYVMYLKKTISPNSIPIYFAPIELFYVMNDLNLNFKKIRKLFPEKVKKGNERGYTHEEVRIILNAAKTKRNKALVLLYASSGCRLGAIPDIKLKHLTKIEESYAVKIYEGDKEEDYVFTTPEATKVIDSYLNERKKDGELVIMGIYPHESQDLVSVVVLSNDGNIQVRSVKQYEGLEAVNFLDNLKDKPLWNHVDAFVIFENLNLKKSFQN